MYAYRPGALNDENINAVITPGTEPSNQGTPEAINAFHATHAHANKGALRKTAKRLTSPSRESCTDARAANWRRASEYHSPRRHTVEQSTPSVEGEGCDSGMNREASSFSGDTEAGDDESESNGEGVEVVTSEADDIERPFGEGLVNASATSYSF